MIISLRKFLIEPIEKVIEQFAETGAKSLSGFSSTIFGCFVSIWVAYKIYDGLVKGEIDFIEMGKKMVFFTVVAFMINTGSGVFKNFIYAPIKSTTDTIVCKILSVGNKNSSSIGNSKDALDKIEDKCGRFLELSLEIKQKAGLFAAVEAGLFGLVVYLAFIACEGIYAFHISTYLLRLSVLWVLSPLLMVCFAFEQTRGQAIGALRHVLGSSLTIIISSFCLALIIFSLNQFEASVNVATITEPDVFKAFSSLSIVAAVSIYYLLVAQEMAFAISGSQSSSLISGLAGASIAGLAGLSMKKTGNLFANVAKLTGSSAYKMGGKVANHFLSKFRGD
jgi:hypothetical protein